MAKARTNDRAPSDREDDPTVPKTFICCCEDILVDDIEAAIAEGHTSIESLKRYTGFGTGICQGKTCIANVARILGAHVSKDAEEISPFTPRPPLSPLPLHLFAASDGDEDAR